ncbi:MAG: two-component system sensor histidine kinase CreC [Deltaproteobacteria bacterium]|nr:two-component system sensor histidine kinase CreC [Deltaproteobacteria bacterium]
MKIRTRLALTFALLVGIGFYFLTGWVLDELRPRYLESVEDLMVDSSRVLATFVEAEMQSDAKISTQSLKEIFQKIYQDRFEAKIYKLKKQKVDIRIYLTDFNGKVIFDSQEKAEGKDFSQWRDVILTKRGEYGSRSTANEEDPTISDLHVAAPIRQNGNLVGVLILVKPTGNIKFFMSQAKPKIQIVGGLAALLLILLFSLISFWITSPIHRLTLFARKIRDGQRVPLPSLSSPEMREMGSALEEMRESLEGKKYVENYVQTLTHEIKSPLTAIQGAAELLQENPPEVLQKKFIQNILSENQRIQELVERLLHLSSLETKQTLEKKERISLKTLCITALERLHPNLIQKQLKTEVKISEDLFIEGDSFLLEQSLLNLLKNAIEFSLMGKNIVLEGKERDGVIELHILDEGEGIPHYALPRVFEKFYSLPRPESGKKSTGLGLAFVKEVMELHQGKIHLQNRNPNGLQVTLSWNTHKTH